MGHEDHIYRDGQGRLILALCADGNSLSERKVRDGDEALYPKLFAAFRDGEVPAEGEGFVKYTGDNTLTVRQVDAPPPRKPKALAKAAKARK